MPRLSELSITKVKVARGLKTTKIDCTYFTKVQEGNMIKIINAGICLSIFPDIYFMGPNHAQSRNWLTFLICCTSKCIIFVIITQTADYTQNYPISQV